MSYHIAFTQQSKSDLLAIYRYIAVDLQSVQSAEKLLCRLEKEILSLNEMPERHRIYSQTKWKERNLRFMPVDNYLVFYVVEKDNESVTVLRILYGGRDIDRQLEQL